MDDPTLVERLLDHVAHRTSDRGGAVWREPVANYTSESRFLAELSALRRWPTPFCPATMLDEAGSYVARDAFGTPIVVVRGADDQVRAFRNACRHRGRQVVDGVGCERALVCAYHGWTYGLDGSLRAVPHRDGFPDIDLAERGLVEVRAEERHGLVFVTQDGEQVPSSSVDEVAGLVASAHHPAGMSTRDEPINWKILVETFLEGYHIRSTHHGTFYPLQYDNLNVVEPFGENCRITFPYRVVERLTDVPPAERSTTRKVTFVYHLFPNTVIATFPDRILLIVVEPVAVDRSTVITYALATAAATPSSGNGSRSELNAAAETLLRSGAEEDFDAARSVQRGLASGANTHLEFGLYEGGISHFHDQLDRYLDMETDGAR